MHTCGTNNRSTLILFSSALFSRSFGCLVASHKFQNEKKNWNAVPVAQILISEWNCTRMNEFVQNNSTISNDEWRNGRNGEVVPVTRFTWYSTHDHYILSRLSSHLTPFKFSFHSIINLNQFDILTLSHMMLNAHKIVNEKDGELWLGTTMNTFP